MFQEKTNFYNEATKERVFVYDRTKEDTFPTWIETFADRVYPGYGIETKIDSENIAAVFTRVGVYVLKYKPNDKISKDIEVSYFDKLPSDLISANSLVSYTFLDEALKNIANKKELMDWLIKQPIFYGVPEQILRAQGVWKLLSEYVSSYYYRAALYTDLRPVRIGEPFSVEQKVDGSQTFNDEIVWCVGIRADGVRYVNDDCGRSAVTSTNVSSINKNHLIQHSLDAENKSLKEQMKWPSRDYARIVLGINDTDAYSQDELEVMVREDIVHRFENLKERRKKRLIIKLQYRKVKAMMHKRCVCPREVAEGTSIPIHRIEEFCQRNTNITTDTLEKLCKYLRCNYDELT